MRPPVARITLPFVRGGQTLEDADHLLGQVTRSDVKRVVVVGGGYIGLEMAEAFLRRGCRVTVCDRSQEIMASTLDPDMGALVSAAMRGHGIDVRLDQAVTGFEEGYVLVGEDAIEADLVVLGLGVAPNTSLMAAAGLQTGVRGALVVDRMQRASADGVWAAGDCC